MKTVALLTLLFWQAAASDPSPVAMRYVRAVRVVAGGGQEGARQACAVLDARIFPHAAPSLTDLRIVAEQDADAAPRSDAVYEVAYAITLSEAVSEETQAARVLNLGTSQGKGSAGTVFDLEMPARAYTGITLDLDPAVHDFIASATVTGSDSLGGRGKTTALGTFPLFDLASQGLSRDTTIPLQESKFKYLHVVLHVSPAQGRPLKGAARFVPTMVLGAQVPPSREAQTIYTTVAETAAIENGRRESVASFTVPARVPVERVSFVLAPGYQGNFSRAVRVTALAETKDAAGQHDAPASNGEAEDIVSGEDERVPLPETVTGNILRVHASEAGQAIRAEQLAVPAVLGANLQSAAKVEVAVENGDDQPLPIAAVRLEMRQRKICFEAPVAPPTGFGTGHGSGASSGLALFYGGPGLPAPEYDYARRFVASSTALVSTLGPERLNPTYKAPATAEARPFAVRHPELRWIFLIAAICALGVVALKAARNVGR